jgi:DNA-binding CsgD family transcriptional regulator
MSRDIPPADEDEERAAVERGRYLARTTDLTEREAETVAWAELGYSASGITKCIDSTESTVKSRLDRVVAQYGPSAVFGKPESDRGDLSEITHAELMENAGVRQVWRKAAEKHPEHIPAALRSATEAAPSSARLNDGWGSGGADQDQEADRNE